MARAMKRGRRKEERRGGVIPPSSMVTPSGPVDGDGIV